MFVVTLGRSQSRSCKSAGRLNGNEEAKGNGDRRECDVSLTSSLKACPYDSDNKQMITTS